ncbi:hypothetical protein HMPREF0973_01340 [Prevotella veroralis F0319]|uniref:Uncharacterized protein n=1 Tax=Prevotella veroralis F0319 TaxID=649761 RepID=C9MP02_9BACT|nr:hypothetical protein HMPREF0973_01340 [Prevotella veroralis F0319]
MIFKQGILFLYSKRAFLHIKETPSSNGEESSLHFPLRLEREVDSIIIILNNCLITSR